jgi:hypothetical protein
MLNRLFRWLGEPVSSPNLIPADDASQVVTPAAAPHRRRASAFEFDRASLDRLCYSYCDGNFYYFAVGRDDWAPLVVAGFSLVSERQCRTWLDESLRSRARVGTDALESWNAENRPVLDGMGVRLDREFASAPNPAAAGVTEMDLVPFVQAGEMAELFALTWQRAGCASPFLFPGNSEQYIALANHHALRMAYQANEHAIERVTAWLATWLEARGLTVDRQRRLVNLPGYRALFYRAPASL